MREYIEDVEEIINSISELIDETTLNIVLNQNKYKDFNDFHKELIFRKVLFNKDKILKYYNLYKNNKNEKKFIKK